MPHENFGKFNYDLIKLKETSRKHKETLKYSSKSPGYACLIRIKGVLKMKLMLTQLSTKLELKVSLAKTYSQAVGFSDVTILVMTIYVGIIAGTITKNLLPNQNHTGC